MSKNSTLAIHDEADNDSIVSLPYVDFHLFCEHCLFILGDFRSEHVNQEAFVMGLSLELGFPHVPFFVCSSEHGNADPQGCFVVNAIVDYG